jgi:hypothetical protein
LENKLGTVVHVSNLNYAGDVGRRTTILNWLGTAIPTPWVSMNPVRCPLIHRLEALLKNLLVSRMIDCLSNPNFLVI